MTTWKCLQCGDCCKGTNKPDTKTYLIILDQDLDRIATFLSISLEELHKQYRIKDNCIDTSKLDCPFLSGNLCKINPVKPYHCSHSGCENWRINNSKEN